MVEISGNDAVSPDDASGNGPSRSRLDRIIHSKWTASLIVALAVSYSFHIVENRTDDKIRAESRVLECTILRIDDKQAEQREWQPTEIHAILEACRKQVGND